MYTRIMFEDYTGSKNSKVKRVALILKTLEEQVRTSRCILL